MVFLEYAWEKREMISVLAAEHAWMSLVGVLLGTLTAVPLGVFISRRPKISAYVIDIAGMLYTIPSLALLGFLLPFLGLGKVPAIVALTVYSWLPVLRNTCAGITNLDPAIKEAAVGMGSTQRQLFFKVELPLAFPVIMAGIRTVAVLTVGITTMGALIGAGGLGVLIFTGISMMNTNTALTGTIPVAVMAVTLDQILGAVERKIQNAVGLEKSA